MADHFSFSVVLEPQQDGGFTVLVPALPEVVTEGDTEEEALANAQEAIRAILAYRRDNGVGSPGNTRTWWLPMRLFAGGVCKIALITPAR